MEGVVESEGFEPTSRQELKETSTCLASLKVVATYLVFPGGNRLLTRNRQKIQHGMMPKLRSHADNPGRTKAKLISD
jgi:hypothetical protein